MLTPGKRLVFFYHTVAHGSAAEADAEFLQSLTSLTGFHLVDISSSEFLKKRKRHMITLQRKA